MVEIKTFDIPIELMNKLVHGCITYDGMGTTKYYLGDFIYRVECRL